MKIDGAKLKILIFQKGLKQWEVARALGIHEASLSRIIHRRADVDGALVKKLERFLKVKSYKVSEKLNSAN
jgi:plasmid maintenance system antidote protein VapI